MEYRKVMVLFVSVLIMQAAYAGREESGWIKKTGRVAFYGIETAAGCHFFSAFHGRRPQSLWPWDVASKIWSDKGNAGSEALAAIVLLRHGLRGLDKELHLTEQFKK